jgi:hypothetical protein
MQFFKENKKLIKTTTSGSTGNHSPELLDIYSISCSFLHCKNTDRSQPLPLALQAHHSPELLDIYSISCSFYIVKTLIKTTSSGSTGNHSPELLDIYSISCSF